ncbi:glycosyl transferase family 90 [Onishia taeanensis]|uniref:Glycosyl transferase family 90 n=1 Tax=Onishia taeanensis TaxID=284577 RepID=A0A328XMM3_9GAMM|nr:glycosyl transferase family 90 [Halomonas taeanensis]RAR59573.1 glycosyl transferase family 90 [Halomonas taeanensis]
MARMKTLLAQLHKNAHKFRFYARHAAGLVVPAAVHRRRLAGILAELDTLDEPARQDVEARVAYYNRCASAFEPGEKATTIGGFRRDGSWAYYLDLLRYLRFFPRHLRFRHLFGDIREVPERPSFLKSRPVSGDNQHSVLLKLNTVRHYYVVPDRMPFEAKEDRLVWRGACHRTHRQAFVERFHDHPLCDVGDVRRCSRGQPYHRPFMSIEEQLQYKFVLSIEGKDVATNLKWIMASNSLCFMAAPRFETWFMEGRLVPGHHYVQLADDYGDLDEKIAYYRDHPDEARRIIANANAYVAQFENKRRERLVGLLVMDKYFARSGQASVLPW